MTDNKELRQRAEALGREKAAWTAEDRAALSPEEIQRTLYELRVHQIELEMQNEELRRAQAELDAAGARYFDLYDMAPVGYCTLSKNGLILEANLTAATLLGVKRSALGMQPVTRFVLKEDEDIYYLHHKKLSDTGTPQACELRMVKIDGTAFWAHLASTAAQDADGTSVCRVVLSDITERKQTEEALAFERDLVNALLDNTPDHVYFKDKDSHFLRISRSLANRFALDNPMEAVGKTDFDFFAKDHATSAFEDEQKIMKTGIAVIGQEEKESWPDGRETWVSTTKVPLEDAQGRIVGTFGVSRDITERKRSEAALRQSQKLESIGTLAGGIAHDFNNLLNATLGQSALALGKLPKESPARNHINKSIKAAERAADLTRQLLAYSGKGRFLVEEIDLNLLVEENSQMLETSVTKTAQLRFELGSPPPYIQGDAGQIQQVIMNLIINAGEAMGPNPGTITVRTSRVELTQNETEYWKYTTTPLAPGRYASLQVSDNGQGMKPEVLARIFDPFFTTKFTGRGLGLAAVLGIIRGHKGGVRITSEERKGTRFDVVFPIAEASTTADAGQTKKALVVNGEGKTVLVIDDEPFVLELVTDIFTQAKFTVIGALNPLEGIELYIRHQQSIAMVILDYSMPGMDGKATFEELVKINKDVKVLLCSGYTEEEMESAFGDVRPAGFIHKPYQPAALLERMSRVLSEQTREDKHEL